MAKHLSKRDKKGQHGQNVVKLLSDSMAQGVHFIQAEEKTPSIDGVLQLFDAEHDCNRYINVQIKSGNSHVGGKWTEKGGTLYLGIEDVRDWKTSKYPTIIVWVPDGDEKIEAYWRNAQYAKIHPIGVKLKASNRFNKTAFGPLLRLAREHSGILAAPLLISEPLFRPKVCDIKEEAWQFYCDWRKEGARNPVLKDIKITLKGWRHITRANLSQAIVCHKLSLLSCAKEIIASSRQVRYMRNFGRNNQPITMVRITGALKERHRAAAIIDVVLEKSFPSGAARAEYTFLSVYERRHL